MRRFARVAIAFGVLWLLWRGGGATDNAVSADSLARIASEGALDTTVALEVLLEGTVHPIVANDSVRYGDRFIFERRAHRTVARSQDDASSELVIEAAHRPAAEFRFAAGDGGLLIAAEAYALERARPAPRSRLLGFNERNVGFAAGDTVIARAVRAARGAFEVVELSEGPFDRYLARQARAGRGRGLVSVLLRGFASLIALGLAFGAGRAPAAPASTQEAA